MLTPQYRIFGQSYGNFHPADPYFPACLQDVYARQLSPDFDIIYAPKTAFTNRVAQAHEHTDHLQPRWLARADSPADGCLLTCYHRRAAIGFFNADCPILCLYNDSGKYLAVLHAGYRCLIRANRDESNIIDMALAIFNPAQLKAFIFGGIGPCCWQPEYDRNPEILDPERSRHPALLAQCLSRTTRSPAGPGHISVDLYALTYGLLLSAGVRAENISWDTHCTCCAIERGHAPYWSHTRFAARQQPDDGRNFCLTWLELD